MSWKSAQTVRIGQQLSGEVRPQFHPPRRKFLTVEEIGKWLQYGEEHTSRLLQYEGIPMISSPSGKEYGITREKLMEILPFRNLNTQLVYAMTCDSHIKIGRAHSPQARAQGLQTSHVKFVSLIAMWHPSIISEPDAHRTLQQFRVRSEWFQDNIEVRTHIGKWFGLECERRPFCLGLVKKDNESLRAAYERSRFRQ